MSIYKIIFCMYNESTKYEIDFTKTQKNKRIKEKGEKEYGIRLWKMRKRDF